MSFFRLIVFIKLLLFIAFTQGKEDVFKPKEKPQSGDFGNVFEELFFSDNSGEPEFLEENADFSQINATHLLEVQFINRSLLHYQKKANQVQSSLKNRVTDLLNSFRQVHSSEKLFSPLYSAELQQKLNATVANLFTTLDLSPICWASLRLILSDLKHKKLWPLKFIDSVKLFPSGLLDGLLTSVGEYEECLHVASPDYQLNGIQGQYCLAKVALPFLNPSYDDPADDDGNHNDEKETSLKRSLIEHFNLDYDELNNKLKMLQLTNLFNESYFRVGLCLPSTCSSSELARMVNKFLEPLQGLAQIEFEPQCSVLDGQVVLNTHQLVAILILGFFAFFVALSTSYEYLTLTYLGTDNGLSTAKNKYHFYFITFSAWSNTMALFSKSKSSSSTRLNVVGSVMMVFILSEFFGRSYVMPVFLGLINIKRANSGLVNEYFTDRKFIFIRSAIFAASTYVLAYSAILAFNLSEGKSSLKLTAKNYLKYIASRWLSYSRRLLGPILLLYLLPLAGDGPLWHYFDQLYVEPCRRNLLPSLLYTSNYENSLVQVCNQPSLILSALFYLSLATPLLLAIFKHKGATLLLLPCLLLLGTAISAVPRLLYHLPVTPQEITRTTSSEQAKKSFIHYLYATDQLGVPFLIGSLVGYLLNRRPKMNLGGRCTQYFLWVGMVMLPLIAVAWNEHFSPLEGHFTHFNFISWLLLSKAMWSLGFGWVVYASATRRGFGPMSDLLAMPLLQPLSRLSFGVYLNHITILGYRQLTKKEITPLTHVEILTDDIADIVIAFAVSYCFYILIERPFYHWIRIVIPLEAEQEKEENNLNNNNVTSKESASESLNAEEGNIRNNLQNNNNRFKTNQTKL